MPSIQGSSSIGGSGFALTGPAGNTGPIGETGNIGLLGITAGVTGATGVYIKQVTTSINPLSAGVYFYLSNGVTIGPISGFTGPSITYYNSKGISGSFASDYFNAFIGISGGMTFVFRGICGDGQYTRTSLSSDGTEIILTISDIPSGSVLLGTTSDDFITFTNSNYTATNSRIRVQSQTSEDNLPTSSFKSVFNYGILEFGLTANPDINPVSEVKTFVDFTTPFININGLNRNFTPGSVPITDGIKKVDSGGYVLDLDKSSVFKLTTPIGITAFSRKRADNQSRSWLFFIEGSDVWNFPQNVQFESGISGIENYAFSSGMNILRIETPMSGDLSNYNASFVDRFFGSDVPVDYGGIGSCCYSGGCEDYVTREYCEDVRSGTFNALINCENSCRVGSCCVGGVCNDTVLETTCNLIGGNWSSQSCSLRGPCNYYYQIQPIVPTNPLQTIDFNNTATVTTPQVLATFIVKTNKPNTNIFADYEIVDDFFITQGEFKIRDINGILNDTQAGYTLTNAPGTVGVTFALIYDNSRDNILEGQIYSPIDYTIKFRDDSGVERATLTYKLRPNRISTCNGRPNSRPFSIGWSSRRYCRDCYTEDVNTGTNYYYPVQQQYGSCSFCIDQQKNNNKYVITPICIETSEVEDLNDCTITKENDLSPDPGFAATCKHSEWGMNTNNCVNGCESALDILTTTGGTSPGCKGVSLSNQEYYPYWHTVLFNNTSELYNKLNESLGITLQSEFNQIFTDSLNFIKNANNSTNQKSVLYTPENENTTTTFYVGDGSVACCPAEQHEAVSSAELDFFSNASIQNRYFVIFTSVTFSGVCEGLKPNPKHAGLCRVYDTVTKKYAMIVKVVTDAGGYIIQPQYANQFCIVDIIELETINQNCFNGSSANGLDCSVTECGYSRNNDFKIDKIGEIKFSDTVPGGASLRRKPIINRISVPASNCPAGSVNYILDLKHTENWTNVIAFYAGIETKLYQYFWYPLFCQDCDGTVQDCFTVPCATRCICENGSPLLRDIEQGANSQCLIQPEQSQIRSITIEKQVSGTNTILTPKIWSGGVGAEAIEQSSEYFYYMIGYPETGNPNDLIEFRCNDADAFKIYKARSGTPITIPTNIMADNEFVVYYTDGQDIEYNQNSVDVYSVPNCNGIVTRSAPIKIVKKYREPTCTLPVIDFSIKHQFKDYDSGDFDLLTSIECSKETPNCVPLDEITEWDGIKYFIAGTPWKVSSFQYNYFYQYDTGGGQYPTNVTYHDPIFVNPYVGGPAGIQFLNFIGGTVFRFDKFTSTGYNSPSKANIYVTLTMSLYNQTTGEYRTVEKTKTISINKAPLTLTNNREREHKYKLITDENGNSQCVLMDCSVTEDCNILPDC